MITVANKKFKTKKELECFTRDFLTKREGSEIKIGEEGSDFLHGLMMRHPDKEKKINGHIKKFLIHRNFGGHIALSFIDGEGEKSIGWKKCINQRVNSAKADLKEVCRNEISYQVQAFKDFNYYDDMPCPACNNEIPTRKQAHVDHKTIPFVEIFESFYKEYFRFLPTKFESAGNHLGYVFMKNDHLMAEIWKHFHAKKSDFQILCGDCNTKKGASKTLHSLHTFI